MTGNKGEWSEVYALFKILTDKVLIAGDQNLRPNSTLVYPLIEVLRNDANEVMSFTYCPRHDERIITKRGDNESIEINLAEFKTQTTTLFKELNNSNNKGSFALPQISSFLTKIHVQTLKAKSSQKSDLTVRVYDHRVQSEQELGFSIKSQIGGASTLLNASNATHFVYELAIKEIYKNKLFSLNSINSKSKLRDRIIGAESLGGVFKFDKVSSDRFSNNLQLIDSSMPQILSELLLKYYRGEARLISALVEKLQYSNPIEYNTNFGHPFYSYKIRRLLTDVALGMTPNSIWTGRIEATGGYLVVKSDGQIVTYHIYNRNDFEDYLFEQTSLETPSSNRYGSGVFFEENGKIKIKLTLQIRFK